MRVEAPIAPKEPLTQTDFQVLELLANNYSHQEICRKLVYHKGFVGFIKKQIARKMKNEIQEETQDGVRKAIVWGISNNKINFHSLPIPESDRFSSLDEFEMGIFLLVGKGLTNIQIAEQLSIKPGEVTKGGERVYTKLGLKTIYAATALSAYGHKRRSESGIL